MRIAVMGAGGVGGFYGAKLAEAGHDVVFIARGRHLDAISEHGLSIENLSDGRVSRAAVTATDNPATIGRADLILFAVKLSDTATAIDLVAPLVDEETALLSLQNGVIKDLILKARFGDKAVLGGVGYVATAIVRPGVIGQTGSLQRIILGEYDGSSSERVKTLVDSFASTGIDAQASSDIDPLGRASCRERECQYGEIWVGAGELKKKTTNL